MTRIRAAVCVLAAAAMAAPLSAQRELSFFVHATTVAGERVADLKPGDVAVSEDGREASVVRVTPVDWPVKLTVLVDNGYQTGPLLTPYRNGLKDLFRALPAGIEASLLTLAPQPRWVVRPTSDRAQLLTGADRIVPDESAPRTLEGLIEAARRIEQEKRREINAFPVIVVLSTTGPEASTAQDQAVQRMATQLATHHARVHVIMLSTGLTSPTQLLGARQVHVGKSIADLTGGRYEAIAAASRIQGLLGEYGQAIAEAHAFQSQQYLVTVERPSGAQGPLGQMLTGPTRAGVRLVPTAQGLKP